MLASPFILMENLMIHKILFFFLYLGILPPGVKCFHVHMALGQRWPEVLTILNLH